MHVLNKIRQVLKARFDSIDNSRLKTNLLNAIPFWLGAIITGIIAVVYTKLFFWAEMCTAFIFHANKWLFLIITPLGFVIASWLVVRYAPYARGSGIPQVSAAIELSNPRRSRGTDRLLSLRIAIVKILSSLIMALSGGAIGREGPTIQIAGSVFKKINDLLPGWYPKISKRNMLVTGAASGLAAAFNTPLGGIVFAIEELTKTHFSYFKSALLTGVIIAGLTALNILGPYLYLGYPHISSLSLWIAFPVLLTALAAGISGGVMGKGVLYALRKKDSLSGNNQKTLYIIGSGLIVAMLAILVDYQAFGSGKEVMHTTLFSDDKYVAWYIPVLRFIGPVLSFSTGAAGGIFAPSLSAGAGVGSVISGWFHLSASDSNLIILCGMVSFLTGITRSPFTSSILVLEMTDANNIIFYLMFAGLASNLAASVIDKYSFYEHLKMRYIREIEASEPDKRNDHKT